MLGIVFGETEDLELVTEDIYMKQGLIEAGASVAKERAVEEYDAIVTYKVEPKRPRKSADAHIDNLAQLKYFCEMAVTSMYRKGLGT